MDFAGKFNLEHERENMTAQATLPDAIESTIASLPAHMQEWVRKEATLCRPDGVEVITEPITAR